MRSRSATTKVKNRDARSDEGLPNVMRRAFPLPQLEHFDNSDEWHAKDSMTDNVDNQHSDRACRHRD